MYLLFVKTDTSFPVSDNCNAEPICFTGFITWCPIFCTVLAISAYQTCRENTQYKIMKISCVSVCGNAMR